VTGGGGYLGQELVRVALETGWTVRSTWWTQRPQLDAEWVQLDVRDAVAVGRAFVDVDAVVHTAYRQGGLDAWSTNVEGAAVVAAAAASQGARLVHLSSDVVFDGTRGRYLEEDRTLPVNGYGRSKAEAERRVAAALPEATIARTSLLYGAAEPGPQERLALTGTTFFSDEIRSPVQVGDLATALLELLALDAPGPLHLGGAEDISRYEFALLLGADARRIEAAGTTPDRAPDVSLDSGRAAALLTTRLRGVRETFG